MKKGKINPELENAIKNGRILEESPITKIVDDMIAVILKGEEAIISIGHKENGRFVPAAEQTLRIVPRPKFTKGIGVGLDHKVVFEGMSVSNYLCVMRDATKEGSKARTTINDAIKLWDTYSQARIGLEKEIGKIDAAEFNFQQQLGILNTTNLRIGEAESNKETYQSIALVDGQHSEAVTKFNLFTAHIRDAYGKSDLKDITQLLTDELAVLEHKMELLDANKEEKMEFLAEIVNGEAALIQAITIAINQATANDEKRATNKKAMDKKEVFWNASEKFITTVHRKIVAYLNKRKSDSIKGLADENAKLATTTITIALPENNDKIKKYASSKN